MVNIKTYRPAVAMIELIIAIVVMGIVLMSAPLLISQATQSVYASTQQEAIAAAATQMSLVLSRHWDEANTNEAGIIRVLTTNNDVAVRLDDADGNNYRDGTPTGRHRSYTNAAAAGFIAASLPNTFGQVAPENNIAPFDDIDDFHKQNVRLIDNNAAQLNINGDYIDTNIQMNTTVAYLNAIPIQGGFAGNNAQLNFNHAFANPLPNVVTTFNIKQVRVNLTVVPAVGAPAQPVELNKNILLYGFSCNIGGYDINSVAL